jgi:hypothetical protein
MLRIASLAHRYLGIALGVLMLMWCLSGIVLMYVPYPTLSHSLRLSGLAPIDWGTCCIFPQGDFLFGGRGEFQLEMLGPDPVLRLLRDEENAAAISVNLRDGHAFAGITLQQAEAAAAAFGRAQGFAGPPAYQGSVERDQWTVDGSYRRDSPLFRFAWLDPRKPVLYISSHTGAAVQLTTGRQRFWNWLGAIPHWIYFTALRERPHLWTAVVVWAAALGSFLTLMGVYIGFLQYSRSRPRRQWSPYRGFLIWHHVPGLAFGLLALSWVLSGLVSMNPWGFLDESGPRPDQARLRGDPMSGAQMENAILKLKAGPPAPPIVSVRSATLGGASKFLIWGNQGQANRLDASGAPSPLTPAELLYIASTLGGGRGAAAPQRLSAADAYYFPHHNPGFTLPVYRVIADDRERTRYYIDPVSGALLAKFGANSRAYRWLHQAAHRWDFVQQRPLWDALMLCLLAGVTWICATGAYLGLRRLLRSPVSRE